MTEKRFYIKCDECNAWSVWEKDKDVVVFDLLKSDAEVVCKALNDLHEENEQLKQELKNWKYHCSSSINENSILWNEIAIMREQGAKPSSAFEEYCSKFKGDVE